MATVTVKGLIEFNRALDKMRESLPGTVIDVALNSVKIVVSDAVPTIPRISGKAARSVEGFVTGQGAKVVGGQGIEYYRWLELGGVSGRRGTNVRPIRKDGRYIYPAYERNKGLIQQEAEQMFIKAAKQAGLEVK